MKITNIKQSFAVAIPLFAGFAATFFAQRGTLEKMIAARQKWAK